ncbi:MAG: hypothetical protein COA53_04270 [Rhodobacteraceae bacterium]|nr:MAG: hypothetical protein COA53_04270 [Paracoccaceae bacterium]
MGRSVESWFLALYDKRPFMGSLVGLTLLFVAFSFIGVATAAINELAGLSTIAIVFLLSPVFIYLLKPVVMVVLLANEFIWSSIGIYYFLGIKGRPVRARYKKGWR